MRTDFAPAERATASCLARDSGDIASNPIIDAMMNANYGLFAVLNCQRQILALNQCLLDEMGVKRAESILGLRVGEYLECSHARQAPGGCGTSGECAECGAVLAQLAALESDTPQEGSCLLTVMRGHRPVNLSFHLKCCPIRIGRERYLLMFFQDVGPVKLRAYQELSTIIETSSEGFLICDATGRILDVNQAYCSMSGYERDQLLTMSIQDVHVPVGKDDATSRLEQIVRNGSARFEAHHRTRFGELFDIEASSTYSLALDGLIYSFIRDISERKNAERALAQSQAELESLIESTDDLIWSVDARQFGLLTFNSALKTYFSTRYSLQITTGMTPDDLLTAPFAATWHGYYQRVLAGGAYTFDYLTSMGSHTLSLCLNPLRNSGGEIYGISVFGKRIDKLVKAEEALLESEERFRILTDTTFEGIVISEQGRILDVNSRLSEILGCKRHELIGTTIGDYIIATERDQVMPSFLDHRESVVEHGMVCSDGSVLVVETHGKMIDHNGKRLRLTAIRDITKRKRAEELLRVGELHFRSIFEQAAVGIAMCDLEGHFVRTNDRFRDLLGYTEGELFTRTLSDITLAEDVGASLGMADRLLSRESADLTQEKRYLKKDGTPVWVEEYLSQVHDAAGALFCTIGITQDISARKQLEAERSEYQAQLNSLASELSLTQERERRTIAYEIHDHVVQNMSLGKIMLSNCIRTETYDKLQQVCTILDESIRQMRSLIFDLSPHMLYDMGLIAALEALGERLGREHAFEFNVLDNYPSPSLDETILIGVYQCMRELLLNIVKHAQAANVTLSAETDDRFLRIFLEDDGVGFDTDCSARRAHQQHSIGLFSVRQRMKHLGGSCEIESSQGRGTRVEIQAPLNKPDHTKGEPTHEHSSAAG